MPTFTPRRISAVAAVAACLTAAPGFGAVVVTYNDSSGYAAGDVVTVPVANATERFFFRDLRAGLQTFQVAGSFELEAINLLVDRIGPDAATSLTLLDFGTTDPNGGLITQVQIDAAVALSSFTYIAPSSSPFGAAPNWNDAVSTLTWTLDTPVTLSEDNFYALQVVGLAGTPLVWLRTNADTFADGRAYLRNDGQVDYGTAVFGSAGAGALGNDWAMSLVAVPEPASLALVAVGGLVLLRRRAD